MNSLDTTYYACPKCHLRFPQLAELRGHIDAEHPTFGAAAIEVPSTHVPAGRITMPLDPDRPPPVALAVATQLAEQLDCSLDLVAAPGLGLHDGAQAFLQGLLRQLRVAGTTTATSEVLLTDRPAVAVLDHATDAGADLICLATRAAHGPVHLLFGSVAEAILLGAEVPVLLTGPHVVAPPSPYRSVVACVDGSAHSTIALLVAQRLQERLGADLRLIEVLDPGAPSIPDSYEGAELVRIANSLHSEPADYQVLHGKHPDVAITQYVNRLDDAIVVTGTHGRTGLRSLLVGSVARGVVAGAKHPTLVVPPATDIESFLRLAGQRTTSEKGATR